VEKPTKADDGKTKIKVSRKAETYFAIQEAMVANKRTGTQIEAYDFKGDYLAVAANGCLYIED